MIWCSSSTSGRPSHCTCDCIHSSRSEFSFSRTPSFTWLQSSSAFASASTRFCLSGWSSLVYLRIYKYHTNIFICESSNTTQTSSLVNLQIPHKHLHLWLFKYHTNIFTCVLENLQIPHKHFNLHTWESTNTTQISTHFMYSYIRVGHNWNTQHILCIVILELVIADTHNTFYVVILELVIADTHNTFYVQLYWSWS